jgi:hypothetical protein
MSVSFLAKPKVKVREKQNEAVIEEKKITHKISESQQKIGLIFTDFEQKLRETQGIIEIKEEPSEEILNIKKRKNFVDIGNVEQFDEQIIASEPEITTMSQLKNSSNTVNIFEDNLNLTRKFKEELLSSIPQKKDILSCVDALENPETPLFYQNVIKNSILQGVNIPIFELLIPEYIAKFLEPVDKDKPWERNCIPPINPINGKQLECESILMGGVLLKEFLLPSQLDTLMNSPYFLKTSRVLNFPERQKCCFLCGQRLTTFLFGYFKSIGDQDMEKTNTIIHDYKMSFNCPGGFDMKYMIPAFKKWVGIGAPVLQHNRLHYGAKGKKWFFLDEVFFHDGVMKLQ